MWRTQAIAHLGSQHALSAMLVNARTPKRRHVPDVTDEWIAGQAGIVVDTVCETRSSWQHTHIYAEAQRRVRAAGGRLIGRWLTASPQWRCRRR
ncbi:hypothetical protein [Mycobacterium riyadhense]|uniref:hypothetical protein n=1 Tax=Mycobacterium riyadhense TaxID=486698 RepID=UPI00195C66E4|nr:hypothetical protein [Mycobacterium riyadhense]